MKTVTLSDSHVVAIRIALLARIEMLESEPDAGGNVMSIRDQLDVTRQALDLIEGAA